MKNSLIPIFLLLFFIAEAQSVSVLTVTKKGDSLFEIGEYNKAIPYFLEANRFREAAKSYEAIGSNTEAQKYFNRALSEKSANPKTEFEYAKLLVRVSNYKQADSILQNLQFRFSSNPNFVYERGLVKEFQKDSTAIELFLQVHKMDENNINATYKIARNYVENRKFKEAVPFIEKGLTLDKSSSRFLTLRALKEFYTQEFHEAIATYNLLISKGDSYVSLHENLASAYSNTMQFEKALDQFRILLQKFNDQNPKWHHEVGVLYRTNSEYDKAERHFNIAIGLLETPLSNEYFELFKIYSRKKDYKNEMDALRKALSNSPNDEMALYYLAVAADNYFKDKKSVLGYYENYLKQFGDTGQMRNLAKQRVSDLKKEIHFSKN